MTHLTSDANVVAMTGMSPSDLYPQAQGSRRTEEPPFANIERIPKATNTGAIRRTATSGVEMTLSVMPLVTAAPLATATALPPRTDAATPSSTGAQRGAPRPRKMQTMDRMTMEAVMEAGTSLALSAASERPTPRNVTP